MATGTSTLSLVLREMPYTAAATIASSLVAISLVVRSTRRSSKPKILRRCIPSPRETLIPYLSSAQAAALPYPPDLFPGARDVASPYGTMRAYEWGPEEGKKVVVVHGDTTPAPMLGPIAEALVKRGCRVVLFGTSARNHD